MNVLLGGKTGAPAGAKAGAKAAGAQAKPAQRQAAQAVEAAAIAYAAQSGATAKAAAAAADAAIAQAYAAPAGAVATAGAAEPGSAAGHHCRCGAAVAREVAVVAAAWCLHRCSAQLLKWGTDRSPGKLDILRPSCSMHVGLGLNPAQGSSPVAAAPRTLRTPSPQRQCESPTVTGARCPSARATASAEMLCLRMLEHLGFGTCLEAPMLTPADRLGEALAGGCVCLQSTGWAEHSQL